MFLFFFSFFPPPPPSPLPSIINKISEIAASTWIALPSPSCKPLAFPRGSSRVTDFSVEENQSMGCIFATSFVNTGRPLMLPGNRVWSPASGDISLEHFDLVFLAWGHPLPTLLSSFSLPLLSVTSCPPFPSRKTSP